METFVMKEEVEAVIFYRSMLRGLRTEGVKEIILTLVDGEIFARARLVGDEKEDKE
jgi:hypothetical protein